MKPEPFGQAWIVELKVRDCRKSEKMADEDDAKEEAGHSLFEEGAAEEEEAAPVGKNRSMWFPRKEQTGSEKARPWGAMVMLKIPGPRKAAISTERMMLPSGLAVTSWFCGRDT